ncbi:MAG TPA: hypothetical protein VFE47_16170 [Tepidisphaeraceae bacterium]|jgi:hypothetical protein|nr:hypothetical protein [Tepidisphaeraceae bacterium]
MKLDVSAQTNKTSSCGCSQEAKPATQSCCAEKTAAPSCGADAQDQSNRREGAGPDRRLDRVERRMGLERRKKTAEESGYTGAEQRVVEDRRTGLERRRGPGRRRSDDRKSAEEGEMSDYQFEFVMAIQTYKKVNKKMYPTWTEILEIVNQLGYRKVAKRKIRLETPEPPMMDVA